MTPSESDGLERYYDKRAADRTPEPFGGGPRPRVFVVQKHAARRLHYDLRLEMDGVLKSWAVPRGVSFDPAIKRLAVRTEDHPVDYVDFEGVIPAGNYGAGAMIVWDRGRWVPLENPDTGMKKGKLLFRLEGIKLKGVFTLVKTKGEDDEWLLIKKPDAYSGPDAERTPPPTSILSGLTVEELAQGADRVREAEAEVRALGAPTPQPSLSSVKPMLAESNPEPFTRAGWLFELKYDGFRLLAEKRGGQVELRYRSGREATHVFPDVVRALTALPFDDVLLDGEVCVLDDEGRPHFNSLQKRVQLARERDIRQAAAHLPATYYAFDLLGLSGFDLRRVPLRGRKALLGKLLPTTGVVRFGDHIERVGEAFYEQVRQMGMEGIMAKRAEAPYTMGRSADWLKMRIERTDDFLVVGFNESERPGRVGFRGLHLASGSGRDLVYAGRVGSGFTQAQLREIREMIDALPRRPEPPCLGEIDEVHKSTWVEPKIVVEVRYLLRTEDGHLRNPVFERLRLDKGPDDFLEPEPEAFFGQDADEDPIQSDQKVVPFTNLDKVFWPREGYTKGDLVDFYRVMQAHLRPYLRDRPVVLTRYPDGVEGKSFFQKDAPPFVPGWVRTERMWSQHAKREIDYFVADDVETLLYLVNMGTIPLHVWSSRVATLQRPDWCIIDLDPKEAPFADVITLARACKSLCDDIGLPSYVKTSGSTGLHVLVPLGGQCTYDQSRQLAELISRILVAEHPDIATITRAVGARGGRVYLDYLQNRHGQLLAAPYSVRPLAGATVSAPLEWDEVGPALELSAFTIETMPDRVGGQAQDPLRKVLDERPDLGQALGRLAGRMGAQ